MFGFGKTPEEKFFEAVAKVIVRARGRPIVDKNMALAFVNDHKSMFRRFFDESDSPELAVQMAVLSCCDNLMGKTSDRDNETCPLAEGIIIDLFKWALQVNAENDPEGNGTKLFLAKGEELEKFYEMRGDI